MVEAIEIKSERPQEDKVRETYKGLCSTCKNAAHCTFPRNPDKPVLHCDEFVGFEYEKTEDLKTKVKTEPDKQTGKGDSQFKGLCKICAKRETCTFPKPETGVWQCEEYE